MQAALKNNTTTLRFSKKNPGHGTAQKNRSKPIPIFCHEYRLPPFRLESSAKQGAPCKH
jgi:hypothetical protein